MSAPNAKVALVDDDEGVRRALERLLRAEGYDVIAYTSAEECLGQVEQACPDCLLLDLQLPGLSGLALQDLLAENGEGTEIVFLTAYGDVPSSVKALKGGAVDFLEKPVEEDRLLASLGKAIERSAARRRDRKELEAIAAAFDSLTPREQEVLREVVSGRLNKQIAGRLGIAEGTVKVHRGQVMRKMRASSLAALVRMASRLGIESRDLA